MKSTSFEGSIRVPAWIFSPLLTNRARVSDEYIHITDWFPTLYKLAGGDLGKINDIDGMDMWSVLNGKEKSKRKDILVNVDEIFETKAAIMGKYKLVQGMRPIFDDFFGKNPKDYSPETYDILAVTSSMAGRTIMNLNDYDLPREENMIEMRDKATIRCGAKLDPKFKKCYEPCLFDIQNDPCETTDILQQNPEVSTIGFIFIALI